MRASTEPVSGADVDVVVVGTASTADGVALLPGAEAVDQAFDGGLTAALTALGASGKPDQVTTLATRGALTAPVLLAVGVGAPTGGSNGQVAVGQLRRAAGAAVRALPKAGRFAFALPADDAGAVAAIAEGALLGAYRFVRYKSSSGADNGPPTEVVVHGSGAADADTAAALDRAGVVAASTALARDWVNTAPAELTPASFADQAAALASDAGLEVEVLDEQALEAGGYGGLIGVGQGSANPPRLLRIAYAPEGATTRLALVGKGITFDSGGLSLKPSDAMKTMKCDMSGAAAVIAAVLAAAELGVGVEVVAYAALAENMPSGSAQRVGDVLTIYGGTTVEVLNTDAEGRLVLADALVRSAADAPDVVLDVATLTGACVVALGTRIAGVMSTDDALTEELRAAADAAGERLWPLPLPEDMRSKLDSPIADLANIGDRDGGGALQAGLFLSRFAPAQARWAHLDIAGPAFNTGTAYGEVPAGGTGFAVRTLVAYAERLAG